MVVADETHALEAMRAAARLGALQGIRNQLQRSESSWAEQVIERKLRAEGPEKQHASYNKNTIDCHMCRVRCKDACIKSVTRDGRTAQHGLQVGWVNMHGDGCQHMYPSHAALVRCTHAGVCKLSVMSRQGKQAREARASFLRSILLLAAAWG